MNDGENGSQRRASRALALAVGALLAVLVLVWSLGRDPPAPTPTASGAAGSISATNAVVPSLGATVVTKLADGAVAAATTGIPQILTDDELRAWKAQMEEAKALVLEKTKYPPDSQPLAGKTDLIEPHHVEPTQRHLAPGKDGGAGNVIVTLSQSQLWLAEGEFASAKITVTTHDGSKPSVQIHRATLYKFEGKGDPPGAELSSIAFHDDGVAPDVTAGDNVFSVTIPPRPEVVRGITTGLVLDVDLSASDERGRVQFNFASTGPAPAKFTGVVTSGIEQGSLAFHVGVEVSRPGRYSIMARLYDAQGAPAALLTFLGELGLDSHELVLTAFGKLLRDQKLKSPFTLKDLEGHCFVRAEGTDRAVMAVLPGPFTSDAFDMAQLSDADWDSPEKSKQIDLVNAAIAHGPSEIAPVDSMGIPVPPKPLILPSTTPTTSAPPAMTMVPPPKK